MGHYLQLANICNFQTLLIISTDIQKGMTTDIQKVFKRRKSNTVSIYKVKSEVLSLDLIILEKH